MGLHRHSEERADLHQETGPLIRDLLPQGISLAARYRRTVPARREARRTISMQSLPDQLAATREGRLRELRWKNSAWLVTADTIAGWNGFEIRNAGSGRSPVRKRSG